MRLRPIEKPKGLMMKIAYFMTRRQFGKVMIPMKVVLARMPGSEKFSWEITKFALNKIHLPHELHFMLGVFVSFLRFGAGEGRLSVPNIPKRVGEMTYFVKTPASGSLCSS
jgi:hypothetical protein